MSFNLFARLSSYAGSPNPRLLPMHLVAAALCAALGLATQAADAQDAPWGNPPAKPKPAPKPAPKPLTKAAPKPAKPAATPQPQAKPKPEAPPVAKKAAPKPAAPKPVPAAVPAARKGSDEGQVAPAEPPKQAPKDEPAEDGKPEAEKGAPVNFFDALAPHGRWVPDAGYGMVWIPTLQDTSTDWAPYRDDGRWVVAKDGAWAFKSDHPWGNLVFHYGRWVWSKERQWAWVPGRAWAPSWVAWRLGEERYPYVGWAPLPADYSWEHGREVPKQSFRANMPYWYVPATELFAKKPGGRAQAKALPLTEVHLHSKLYRGNRPEANGRFRPASPSFEEAGIPVASRPQERHALEQIPLAPPPPTPPPGQGARPEPAEQPAAEPVEEPRFAEPPPPLPPQRHPEGARPYPPPGAAPGAPRLVRGTYYRPGWRQPLWRCQRVQTTPPAWRCGYR